MKPKNQNILIKIIILFIILLSLQLSFRISNESYLSREIIKSETTDPEPKLLIISSNISDRDKLANAAKENVIIVQYDHEKTSLSQLVSMVKSSLCNRKVSSIGIATHNYGLDQFYLTKENIISINSTLTDIRQQKFWLNLCDSLYENGRIDLFACNLTSNNNGKRIIAALESLTNKNFAASKDITGNYCNEGNWILETDNIDLSDEYFSYQKLKKFTGIFATPTFVSGNITGDEGDTYKAIMGDVNGDGFLDIYVANFGTQNRLWINDGTGSFTSGDIAGDEGNSQEAIMEDLNGDGHIDIYVVNTNSQNRLWINNGSGSFTSGDISGDEGKSKCAAIGDVNNDGYLDIYVANWGEQHKLWINNGSGQFNASDISADDTGNATKVLMGDINNDGYLDIYLPNYGYDSPTQNHLWINNQSGGFIASHIDGDEGDTRSAALGDIDNDGNLDIYTANYGKMTNGDYNVLWINDGTTFTFTRLSGDQGESVEVAMADVNNDGYVDIYVSNFNVSYKNKLWINNGDRTFTESSSCGVKSSSYESIIGDVDNDGDLDIYVINNYNINYLYLNTNNTGVFGAGIPFSYDKDYSYRGVMGDLNNDGLLEIYVANKNQQNFLWKQLVLKDEPSNHPTNFAATADSTTQITTSWTDSTGDVVPDGYLVMCKTSESFTNPSDKSAKSDDTNCSDGHGVKNITQGTGTYSWTGLKHNTQYYFKIFPYTNSDTYIDYKIDGSPATDDVATQPKPEPSNHPTNFDATADSTSQITTSWTDSTGDTVPEGYLVMCKTSDSFTDPVDGTEQTDDTNCLDGSGIKNITQGTGTYAWTGLSGSTQYYFKIFPYTNSGTKIDYKIDISPATDDTTTLSKPEPTNHPTNFKAEETSTGIKTSWTDSTGTTLPDSYLVMCSTSDSFTDPVDTTAQTDDTDCSDGSCVKNIIQGTGSYTWTGLTNGTQYYFKIFPYTNSGAYIDFKTGDSPATGNATYDLPTVTAGDDATQNAQFDLEGIASDTGSGLSSSVWTKVSGSGDVIFGDSSSPTSSCRMTENDTYELKLTATDNVGLSNSDTVTITWTGTQTQTVTTSDDSGAESLREIVADAEDGALITFNIGGSDTVTINNEINISKSITINGTNSATGNNITLQVPSPGEGGSGFRVFNINCESDKLVNIKNMTIKGGDISALSDAASYGGAIFIESEANINLENVTISDSKAAYGGGIYNIKSTLSLSNCVINGNTATSNGGGINNAIESDAKISSISIEGSTISNNQSTLSGGGIMNFAKISLTKSTIAYNDANYRGGGIYNVNTIESMSNCTIAYNKANSRAGGIYNDSTIESISNCTIAYNHSDNDDSGDEEGGGLYLIGSSTTIRNTILAHNYQGSGTTTADDYYYSSGTLTDDGYNIVEYSNACAKLTGGFSSVTTILYNSQYNDYSITKTTWTQGGSALSNQSLNLASNLADNGGSTQTIALEDGSFAIDAIPYSAGSNTWNNSPVTDGKYYDQCGTSTEIETPISIGAYSSPPFYYRTANSGNWSTASTWEQSLDGLTWESATSAPDKSGNSITILNGHTITVDKDITIDQTVVESGGTLSVGDGITLQVSDGDGTDLTVAGTLELIGTSIIDINGSLDATGGNITFTDSGILKLGSTVTSLGTFTPGTGTVIFDGTSQTVPGSNTYYNLTKTVTIADTLTFESGTTTTVTGTLTLQGAEDQLLSLRSSSDGTQWEIDPQSTQTLSYLDVKDSNNIDSGLMDVVSNNCTDSGNNTNWAFVDQEIDIKGNSQSITDGDDSPSTTDDTDFGGVDVDTGDSSHTFTIYNTGDKILSLSDSPRVTISGTNSGDFTLTTDAAASVDAGDSTTFTIKFNPSELGTRTAAISIANNDGDENPYNFNIQGIGNTTHKVANTDDTGANSLRQIIIDANDGDTIDCSDISGTITLTSTLEINKSLTIIGSNSNGLTISGNDGCRVLQISSGKTVTLRYLTISAGSVADDGAGILNQGTLTIDKCAIINNSATGTSNGGGIKNTGTLTIKNTTISGNSAAGNGGGIDSESSFTLNNVTIHNNTATGSGLAIYATSPGTIGNSIISGGCAGSATHTSNGHNIETDTSCGLTETGDLQTTDPKLKDLGDYGGPTKTHALDDGSPAIDAGDTGTPGSGGTSCESTDQRGITRAVDGNSDSTATCDIGAVEYNPGTLSFTSSTADVSEGDGKVTVTVARSGGSDGSASVKYTSSDSTALAGKDYTAVSDTLTWDYGVKGNKTFTVNITDDNNFESKETFNVSLSDFSIASQGTITTSSITIKDNDEEYIPPASNSGNSGSDDSNPDNQDPDEQNPDDQDPDDQDPDEQNPDDQDPDDEQKNPLLEAVDKANDAIDKADKTDSGNSEKPTTVNEAVQKASDAVQLATEMIDKNTATPKQALITLNVVDNAFKLLGQSAKNGETNDIDTDNIVDTLDKVSNISKLAVETGQTTDEEKKSIVTTTDNILKSMPDIIASVDKDNGLKIIAQVDDIVESGLKAGLSSAGADTTKLTAFIDSISDVITALALDTTISGNTNIVKSAVNIISKAVNTAKASANQSNESVVAQLQKETGSIIEAIHNNLLKNILPFSDLDQNKSFNQKNQARDLTKAEDTYDDTPDNTIDRSLITKEKIKALTKEVSNIVKPFIDNSTPLGQTLLESILEVIDDAFESIIDQLALSRGIDTSTSSLVDNESGLLSAIQNHPSLLKDILEISSVDITKIMSESTLLGKIMLQQIAAGQLILSDNSNAIKRALPKVIDLDCILLEENSICPFKALKNAILHSIQNADASSLHISEPGMIKGTLKWDGTNTESHSILLTSVKIIPSSIPDGIYLLPDGQLVTIYDNIAVTAAPIFSDLFTLVDELVDLDMDFKILDDCRWTATLNDESIITGMIAYREHSLPLTKKTPDYNILFELIGDEASSKDYSIVAVYNESIFQLLPPALYSLDQLVQLLDELQLKYTIDRDNGVITIQDAWLYKPDYIINAIDSDDLQYWEQNKDELGIAWKQDDFNQDGIMDLEMLTSEGKQILYQIETETIE